MMARSEVATPAPLERDRALERDRVLEKDRAREKARAPVRDQEQEPQRDWVDERDRDVQAPGVEEPTPMAVPMRLRNLSKRWRKDLPPVLAGLDLTLAPGTATWVGGRNGVGKTTMLRIAAGLIEPDQGRAEVWGFSARESRARYQELVSFLPAGDRGLYARLTVRRQLEFWARIAMVPGDRLREAVDGAIATFELGDLAERRVDRMSMGQRQRLRIAMTFLTRPEIVLLDEPLTSLDAEGAALLQAAIDDVLARDGAVLWCSPSGERVDAQFDARWTIERGRLVAA
jgi:ABC-2 type transport system ATP-binding protein